MIETVGPRMTKFNLADVRIEAAAIIQRACDHLEQTKAQAREILDQARAEAQTLRQRAQSEGYQTGHAQGLEQGSKEGQEQGLAQAKKEFTEQSQQLRSTLENILVNFETQRDHFLAQAHQDLLALALAIAAKITHHQVNIDPQVALNNVKSVVGLVHSRSSVLLKMNPKDIERYELLDQQQAEKILNSQHIKVIQDENIEIGGCVLQTENGVVDAQISTQLQNLVRQLAPDMEQAVKSWAGNTINQP